jgi:phosphate-selective porin
MMSNLTLLAQELNGSKQIHSPIRALTKEWWDFVVHAWPLNKKPSWLEILLYTHAERQTSESIEQHIEDSGGTLSHRNAATCLLLPGKTLHLNAVLSQRKFRDRGNKTGAVQGLKVLEEAGLGKLILTKPPRGATMVNKLKLPSPLPK